MDHVSATNSYTRVTCYSLFALRRSQSFTLPTYMSKGNLVYVYKNDTEYSRTANIVQCLLRICDMYVRTMNLEALTINLANRMILRRL